MEQAHQTPAVSIPGPGIQSSVPTLGGCISVVVCPINFSFGTQYQWILSNLQCEGEVSSTVHS